MSLLILEDPLRPANAIVLEELAKRIILEVASGHSFSRYAEKTGFFFGCMKPMNVSLMRKWL